MSVVTRYVREKDLSDLAAVPPRAYVAFEGLDGLEAMPARSRIADGAYWFGLPAEDAERLPPSAQVRLLVDDGCFWFELRAITVRGVAAPIAPPWGDDALRWFEIQPERVAAWDYGRLRKEAGS